MRYDGPIYRPPSEAGSLLVQATVGCPHNLCTFCMVYKDGVKFKVRPVSEIKADLDEAAATYGPQVRTLFFPAREHHRHAGGGPGGNLPLQPHPLSPAGADHRLWFIPVYTPQRSGSASNHGPGRVGADSRRGGVRRRRHPDPDQKRRHRPGPHQGRPNGRAAGLEINAYVMVGIGGQDRSETHARETARVISDMQPAVVRLRTFVPKVNTPLLAEVQAGRFQMLSPHQALTETVNLLSTDHDAHPGYQRPLHQLSRRRRPAARGPGRHAPGAAPGFGPGRIHLPPVLDRYAII